MNISKKVTPLLAVLMILCMSVPAFAQAKVNVEVNVNNSNSTSNKKGHKKSKNRRSSRNERNHRGQKNKRHKKSKRGSHTVVHEHVVVHEHPAAPQYYPMDDAQFANFLGQIKSEPFSSGKLSVISMAVDYNYFTSGQVSQVVSALTFASDKVDAAVMMHPQVLDPETFYQVFTAFTFESSKDEVRARLGI